MQRLGPLPERFPRTSGFLVQPSNAPGRGILPSCQPRGPVLSRGLDGAFTPVAPCWWQQGQGQTENVLSQDLTHLTVKLL